MIDKLYLERKNRNSRTAAAKLFGAAAKRPDTSLIVDLPVVVDAHGFADKNSANHIVLMIAVFEHLPAQVSLGTASDPLLEDLVDIHAAFARHPSHGILGAGFGHVGNGCLG
ncbi:MAG: hypothetical protein ACU826_00100 [Gammaproteobacteria bacterium]